MKSEQFNELAALKAVGALDEQDIGTFNDLWSSSDAISQAEAINFLDTAAIMAVAQSPIKKPAAGLIDKIMARVRTSTPDTPSALSQYFFIGRNEGKWETLPIPGVRVKNLAVNPKSGTSVKLYELAPGTHFPEHHHSGPEECFVVSGDFHVESRILHGGDFHHAEAHSDHKQSYTENGCTLLVMVSTNDYD